MYYLKRFFSDERTIVLVVLVFIWSVSLAITAEPETTNTQLSSVDDKILTEMFGGRVYLDESGNPERMTIAAISPSLIAAGKDHPLYNYFVRWRQLYDAHVALKKEGDYAELFGQLQQQLVSEVGYFATQRDGRTQAYALFSSAGLHELIVARAGPSDLVSVPDGAQNDRWGSSQRPYAFGVAEEDLLAVRESVTPFHYCAGMRDQNGHGITISGGQHSPFVRAHTALYRADASYKQKFDTVMVEYVERARALDPMDFAGSGALTRDLRDALIEAGVADAIEQFLNDGTVAVVSHTPGERELTKED